MFKKLLLITLGLFSISNAQADEWVVGGIYATPNEGGYTLIKILKVDNGGVHIRMYSNLFKEIPSKVDETKLFMAQPDNKDGLPLGMGHAPISHKSFSTWGAIFIVKSTVSESELEGYRMWEDAKGGYF